MFCKNAIVFMFILDIKFTKLCNVHLIMAIITIIIVAIRIMVITNLMIIKYDKIHKPSRECAINL